MPEPFKNLFNAKMIALMGHHFKRASGQFDEPEFVKQATNNIDELELKERSHQIMHAMEICLPHKFTDAAAIIFDSLHPETEVDLSGAEMDGLGIRGWGTMPLTQFVGRHGLVDFDLGMSVQKEITKRGSSEFGVREFIIENQEQALSIMTEWALDQNFHVRRLVSEGSRPRLPWAIQLRKLVENPEPLFPILELLKDDPVEYVRRSVANNLNDIAKDHPDKIGEIAEKWLRDASTERKKLVRHACRTLIKRGHKATLSALGYKKPILSHANIKILTPVVEFGSALYFDVSMTSTSSKSQDLIVDYVIHHRKANGKTSPKVFKWKTITLVAGTEHTAKRKHPIRKITTRVYYEGIHKIELIINGESFGSTDFELNMPQ